MGGAIDKYQSEVVELKDNHNHIQVGDERRGKTPFVYPICIDEIGPHLLKVQMNAIKIADKE